MGAGSHQSSWTGSLPLWGERGTHWIRYATAVENTKTSATLYLKTHVHICVLNAAATLMFMEVERKVQKPEM